MTADQITTLGLAVDSTSVKTAGSDLDAFTDKGEGAANAATSLEAAMRKAGPAATTLGKQIVDLAAATERAGSAAKVLQAAQAVSPQSSPANSARLAEIQRDAELQDKRRQTLAKALASESQARSRLTADAQAAALAQELENARKEQFVAILQREADAIGKTRAELLTMQAAQLGVSDSAAPLIQRIAEASKTYDGAGKSAAQLAQQHQIAAVQVKDFIEQVIAGGSPLRAFAQQGTAVVSTYGGFRNTLTAISGALNPMTVSLVATAAAVGGLGYAYYKGSQEAREFQRTLILTGNAAGVTSSQLVAMSAEVAKSGAGTQGRAAEVLNELAKTGQIAASSLVVFTEAAVRMEKAGGDSAEETVKIFENLAKSPLDAARQLDATTNAFSRSTLEQIRNLEVQGRTTEAAKLAQQAYADSLNERTPQMVQNLGLLEKAWAKIKGGATAALDGLLDIGRQQDPIKQAQDALAALDARAARRRPGQAVPEEEQRARAYYQGVLKSQQEAAKYGQQAAAADAVSAKQKEAGQKWADKSTQFLTTQVQLQNAINAAQNEGIAAGKSDAEIQQRIAQIRQQFDPNAGIAKQIAGIDDQKRAQNSLLAAYQNFESVLEQNRSVGLVGDRQYYGEKLNLINLTTEAQKKLIEADIAEARAQLKAPNLTTQDKEQLNTRIKDDLAAIGDLQARAATEAKNLGTQQTASLNAVSAAYQAARASAQDYVNSLSLANARSLAGYGQGNEARANQAARNQIADKYDEDLLRAQREFEQQRKKQNDTVTQEQQDAFDKQVALIAEFKAKALGEYDDYYAARKKLESDAANGAQEAIRNYVSDQANAAQQMQKAYEDAFSGMEHALVKFIKTGKLNFGALADAIISDLVRIEAKQLIVSAMSSSWGSSLLSALGAYLGGGGVSINSTPGDFSGIGDIPDILRGGRAIGGPVSAGMTYQVNERDIPEIATVGGKQYLTMGNQDGTVTPLAQSGFGPNVNINIGAGVQRSEIVALIPELKRQIKAELAASMQRPGSPVSRG